MPSENHVNGFGGLVKDYNAGHHRVVATGGDRPGGTTATDAYDTVQGKWAANSVATFKVKHLIQT